MRSPLILFVVRRFLQLGSTLKVNFIITMFEFVLFTVSVQPEQEKSNLERFS